MKKLIAVAAGLAVAVGAASRLEAGEGASQLGAITKRAQQFREMTITEADEQRLGAAVSERIRVRYGVVQEPEVHKYVGLVGKVLADASSRPNLEWHFIVLDTDGVNALAAPGGYIHITRGALSLLESEAQLAGVLAHEIEHVTLRHTIRAIQKNKAIEIGAEESLSGNSALFNRLVDHATGMVMAGFGRSEELEADREGVVIANKAGYAPEGLPAFLRALTERNKSSTQKQGLFASHPEMEERLTKLDETIKKGKLAATVTLGDRLARSISYKTVPVNAVDTVPAGSAGLTGGSGSPDDGEDKDKDKEAEAQEPPKKKKGFGLSSLRVPSLGGEKKSAEVTGSGASRGVDREREAKGGSNPQPVVVAITAGDLSAFKKEGGLP